MTEQTTTEIKDTKQPSIVPFLYLGHSVPEIISLFTEALRQNKNKAIKDKCKEHANKLDAYAKLLTNRKILSRFQNLAKKMFKEIDQIPGIGFEEEGRIKTLLSLEKKCLLYLDSETKSLSHIRDILGIRFNLYLDYTEANILRCYGVMHNLIKLCEDNNIIIVKRAPLTPVPVSDIPEGIIIPQNFRLEKDFPEYSYKIRDYICNPNRDGYQALQTICQDTITGEYFEIQVKLFAMSAHADCGGADHSSYKEKKYKDYRIPFDRSKIDIVNYSYSPSQDPYKDTWFEIENRPGLLDRSGIECPRNLFYREKTAY